MCSLVANYDSDEEQQQAAAQKPAIEGKSRLIENSAEFGWSLMQANMQRDMEISDEEAQKEEEMIPAKQLRRKKRIDFVSSTSNRFPPNLGPQVIESNDQKTETSVVVDKKLKLFSSLELVSLPPVDYPSGTTILLKGVDEDVDLKINLKLKECFCVISSDIRNSCEDLERAASSLSKLQALREAWETLALDGIYLRSRLDKILEMFQPSNVPNREESTNKLPPPQSGSFPMPPTQPFLVVPPPPPPPEEEYPSVPPPPPPPPESDLGDALDSFYSEMAGIEAALDQKKEESNPDSKAPEPEPEPVKEELPEPVEMVNKNRKGRISTSVGMKRKNVSSLMEKWNKVKKEWSD
ncbi:uncharacterized protein LOC132192784 [Neocloeon triangulifer]|uniref:uncharacterized protein LOC132192784 n=1 Tax=Neocloeon triangulifer TaxID=2078957 RepID=UPI00286F7F77|nr:uncharacterized protein LOC132192784 [Neocloeon triangulifer]